MLVFFKPLPAVGALPLGPFYHHFDDLFTPLKEFEGVLGKYLGDEVFRFSKLIYFFEDRDRCFIAFSPKSSQLRFELKTGAYDESRLEAKSYELLDNFFIIFSVRIHRTEHELGGGKDRFHSLSEQLESFRSIKWV